MILAIYLKPNRVGLSFGSAKDRDQFWRAMGSNGNSGPESPAEKFGEKIILLHPENFKAKMWWKCEMNTLSPEVESVKNEVKVQAGDLRAQEPMPPIAIIPNEPVTTEMVEPAAPSVELPTPPTPIPIPEVSKISMVEVPPSADDPKPAGHHASKEARAWRERQRQRERLAAQQQKA